MESGFLLLNKPEGITSHTAVNRLRKITGIKKIGHAGTLDPFATGLLIMAIGREATREIDKFVKLEKEYEATLFLGAETDTYDKTGERKEQGVKSKIIELDIILNEIRRFIGPQLQIPPMYSAKKIKGKKLYEFARKGIEIERAPSAIEIFDIKIISYEWPKLILRIECSSGTYIRSLAFDLGRKLGCGAYLEDLKRTKIGQYSINNSKDLYYLTSDNWSSFLFK